MDATTIRRWLEIAAISIRDQRDYLTQLDAAIGDADHGNNLVRGFTAVTKKLPNWEDSPPGKLLTGAGLTLISTVGGASGPLWGTALRRAGRSLGDANSFDGQQLVTALEAALGGVMDLGGAQEGDKTMVDALAPAVRMLRRQLEAGKPTTAALASARAAAEDGMRATIPLQGRKGRASYLGERSIGHQDPGATSTALIAAALEQALIEES